MLRSLSIKRFRGLESLKLDELRRVNLITGRNNTGTTSVLEALFVLAGVHNLDMTIRTNALRGIESFAGDPEAVWGWLFFEKRTDAQIEISAQDASAGRKRLVLKLEQALQLPEGDGNGIATTGSQAMSTAAIPRELVVTVYEQARRSGEYRVAVTGGGLRKKGDELSVGPSSYFFSPRYHAPADDADRFSQLVQMGQDGPVLEAMRILDDRIRRLVILSTGGRPSIAVDIGQREIMPIGYLGDGSSRLMSILCGVGTAKGGLTMVDEIGMGMHYSVMDRVWRQIATIAEAVDSQVFATTHSWECIAAAARTFDADRADDFRFFRLERDDSTVRAVAADTEAVQAAVELNFELR